MRKKYIFPVYYFRVFGINSKCDRLLDDCISSSAQMFTHALPNGKLHDEDGSKGWKYSQQ